MNWNTTSQPDSTLTNILYAYPKITISGTKLTTSQKSVWFLETKQLTYIPPIQEITLITNFIQQNQSSADFTVRCVNFFVCGDKILKGHFSQHSFLNVCIHFVFAGGSVAGAQSVDPGKLCCFHKMLQRHSYLRALFGCYLWGCDVLFGNTGKTASYAWCLSHIGTDSAWTNLHICVFHISKSDFGKFRYKKLHQHLTKCWNTAFFKHKIGAKCQIQNSAK